LTDDVAFTLRLFRRTDPFRPIECREIRSGRLEIGRDPAAGWPVDDPELAISRRHCILAMENGRLTLRDTSTNGVYIGPERRRAPASATVEIAPGEAFRFGPYMIAVDHAPSPYEAQTDALPLVPTVEADDADKPRKQAVVDPLSLTSISFASRSEKLDAGAVPAGESLLDAFCSGAGFDPSSFLDEDPVHVMRRVGAVYQCMVVGLTELMEERTTLKNDYELERTTVHARGNNPFRWASAESVALDLLRARADGFLSGPEAVEGAFKDLKSHLSCMLAGLRGAVRATLERLSPPGIESRLERRSWMLRSRGAVAWRAYGRLHEDLRREAEENAEGLISRSFRTAYQHHLRGLQRVGRVS
jgi:predicted component of type VI protein secretion system